MKIRMSPGRRLVLHDADLTDSANVSMEKESKIYVAGYRGLVGSTIVRHLREQGYKLNCAIARISSI